MIRILSVSFNEVQVVVCIVSLFASGLVLLMADNYPPTIDLSITTSCLMYFCTRSVKHF